MVDLQSPALGIPAVKKMLKDAGFQIFETQEDHLALAERVRDNLILDSGIAVHSGNLSVRVAVRAQASHFPGQAPDALASRANSLAEPFLSRGYSLELSRTRTLPDPGDPERHLDTAYEVVIRRMVADEAELVAELRAAFGLHRSTSEE
jgi:hypothetical protein